MQSRRRTLARRGRAGGRAIPVTFPDHVPIPVADERRHHLAIAKHNPVPERLTITFGITVTLGITVTFGVGDGMRDTHTNGDPVADRHNHAHTDTDTDTDTHRLCHGFWQRDSDTRHSVLQWPGLGCPPVVARTVSQLVSS